jgi:hypothetical protein
MGFIIIADPPEAVTSQARLEIKEWGMIDTFVPYLFLRLFHVYQHFRPGLCATARRYAGMSYSMLVGERGSLAAHLEMP